VESGLNKSIFISVKGTANSCNNNQGLNEFDEKFLFPVIKFKSVMAENPISFAGVMG
jgi:hypothetical protein